MLMKKLFYAVSIIFVIVNVMFLFSCSDNVNDVLTTSVTSSATAYVENSKSLDYFEVGKLPEEYTKEMDKEEKEAWEKLSTKYRIKKNVLSSKFYQEHKSEIIERIKFLYQYAVDKNQPISDLSFVWADQESGKKEFRLLSDDDTTNIGGSSEGSDSDDVDNPYVKVYEKKASYRAYDYKGVSMVVSLPYKIIETGSFVTVEENGPSTYELEPTYATFSGNAGMSIDGWIAHCIVKGYIRYNFFDYRVDRESSTDLYKDYENTKS